MGKPAGNIIDLFSSLLDSRNHGKRGKIKIHVSCYHKNKFDGYILLKILGKSTYTTLYLKRENL